MNQAEAQRLSNAIKQAEKNGDQDSQLRLYKQLAAVVPPTALLHAQIAHLLFERNEIDEAASHTEIALKLPADPKVDQVVFQHLCKQPRYTHRLQQAREWFEAQPNIWRFKLLYEALHKAGANDELENALHRMLESPIKPEEQSQLLTLLAQLYFGQARYHDCIACYKLGLELTPGNRTQLFNLAGALEQVARYEESFQYYQKVLEIDPLHAGTHNNISLIMLRLGEFEHGWKHNEWRWKGALADHVQTFNISRWQGEPLEGKRLIVWGEQGIGDHIMFASVLNELKALGGTLFYEIYARLDTLFERSFEDVQFLRRDSQGETEVDGKKLFKQTWPQADYHIPAGSVASLLRKDLASFGKGAAFLTADPAAVEGYLAKYQNLFPGKRLIGVSWRGGRTLQTERQSRFVKLPELARLAALENVQFIDLQYDSTPEEIAELQAAGLPIYHDDTVDARVDMDPQASQVAALDAVISVDNTTIHLAGALGIPTYTLIQLNPNWRWGLKEGRSYWYNSVRLFRNKVITDWQEVLDRVMIAVREDGLAG